MADEGGELGEAAGVGVRGTGRRDVVVDVVGHGVLDVLDCCRMTTYVLESESSIDAQTVVVESAEVGLCIRPLSSSPSSQVAPLLTPIGS